MDPGMDPAGAFPVLERELRAALAEDERRQREGEAKLRALRQGVPDYDQFRSGARGLARGGSGTQRCSGDPRSSSLGGPGTAPRAEPTEICPETFQVAPCALRSAPAPVVGGCRQQWSGTVPSPGHCHGPRALSRPQALSPPPNPTPAPVSPAGHAGSAEQRVTVPYVPCVLPSLSLLPGVSLLCPGDVSGLGWQSCPTGALPVPSKLQDSPGIPLGAPCPLTPTGRSRTLPTLGMGSHILDQLKFHLWIHVCLSHPCH